jgi:hypothetical protein
MNQHEQLRAEDDEEISFIDVLLFLKASGGNIVKSTLICLLAGGVYYFYVPKMYEASATIEMAMVAGELVETPAFLLEKMKLPLYFSPVTLQACGSDVGLSSQYKFVDKIKPTINKSAPMLSFVTQAPSTQEAKACLNLVITEVSNNQDAIAKDLLKQKKQKLQLLNDLLRINEDNRKTFPAPKGKSNAPDEQFSSQTRSVALISDVYALEVAINKRPLFTLGFCLALGVFVGLFLTGVMRVAPRIRLQMRKAEGSES